MKLNIGCGRNILEGWLNVDREPLPGVDITVDLEFANSASPYSLPAKLPMDDDTVDEFLLSHIIEHLHHPLNLMQELHRVAKPGAKMVIATPYGSSDDAWEDPTHVRPYFIGSFGYFGQPNYWRADYQYRGDWKVIKIMLHVKPSDFVDHHPPADHLYLRNTVSEMIAVLEAVKPIRAPDKELQEQVKVELITS